MLLHSRYVEVKHIKQYNIAMSIVSSLSQAQLKNLFQGVPELTLNKQTKGRPKHTFLWKIACKAT